MSRAGAALPAVDRNVTFELLASGERAFARILHRIDTARVSIQIRSFSWRDDQTGQAVAAALLRAAERGVTVAILKDRVGMHYEYFEGDKQSFFHKVITPRVRLQTWFLMAVYGQWGSLRQRPSPLADALLAHPNVTVHRDEKRFDHSKLYVFDDETVILGGMGIGDDSRLENVDFMVEITGAEAARRLAERHEGRAAFDPQRSFDFLLHSFTAAGGEDDSLGEQRLRLIDGARERLTIEMAYLGDRACASALVAAVKRGVQVTLLTSSRANILGDLNLRTCNELLRRTDNAPNLRVFLHPRMVHGKAMVVDGARVDLGSANFTPLSHGGYEEVNLHAHDRALAAEIEAAIERDAADSRRVQYPVPHDFLNALIESVISSYQAGRSR
jgi:cardiolipin synthase